MAVKQSHVGGVRLAHLRQAGGGGGGADACSGGGVTHTQPDAQAGRACCACSVQPGVLPMALCLARSAARLAQASSTTSLVVCSAAPIHGVLHS